MFTLFLPHSLHIVIHYISIMPRTLADTFDTYLSFTINYLIVLQLSSVDQSLRSCQWMFSIKVGHKHIYIYAGMDQDRTFTGSLSTT